VWIVPASLYSKVRVIFAMQPVHFNGEKFVVSITAQYQWWIQRGEQRDQDTLIEQLVSNSNKAVTVFL